MKWMKSTSETWKPGEINLPWNQYALRTLLYIVAPANPAAAHIHVYLLVNFFCFWSLILDEFS